MSVPVAKRNSAISMLKLLRPSQWAKNLFLVIPPFFAGEMLHSTLMVRLGAAFICFSGIASAVYIFNDYRDLESDRKHPKKRNRPLAAGEVEPRAALVVMSLLAIGSLSGAFYLDASFLVVLLVYVGMNIGYSLGLKNISILDVMIIAFGFLLRTVAGGLVVNVPVSQWLVIMIFLLALFLALAKRRDDLLVGQASGQVMRKSVKNYNLEYVNACLIILAGIIIVSYLMYTISDEVVLRLGDHLYFTSVFVIAGMMRYLQIALVENDSGSPTDVLYTDRFLQLTLLAWIASFFALIYLSKLM